MFLDEAGGFLLACGYVLPQVTPSVGFELQDAHNRCGR